MITFFIIGINLVLSLYCFSNQEAFDKLSFTPYQINENKSLNYKFLSHAFIHADWAHLIFNMITLYFFGKEVEHMFSSTEYILFYLCAIVFAVLPTFQKNKFNPQYKAVGASGAVSAVMFSLVLYSPWSVVYLKFFIPIYFVLFAFGYLIYSSYQSNRSNDNIAHSVHLWGALFGIAYMLIIHPSSLRVFIEQIKNAPFLK